MTWVGDDNELLQTLRACVTIWLDDVVFKLNYQPLPGTGARAPPPTLFSGRNGPFPSSLLPMFENESKCETFHMKISFACSFIFMQIKVIFIRIVSHLDSLGNRGTRELGNGLFSLDRSQIRAWFVWKLSKNCRLDSCPAEIIRHIVPRQRHSFVFIVHQ